MSYKFCVAIDGPSGVGKSSLAKAAAARYGFLHMDTGAIYRTVGLAASRAKADLSNEGSVMDVLRKLEIRADYGDKGEQRMYLNDEDVTEEIRMPEISTCASKISTLGAVREYLLEMQRAMARERSVVMDGRDIGTVVLPDADVKIFLTASAEKRAERRMRQLEAKGTTEDYERVLSDIITRDERDSTRAAAPLVAASDSVHLDTSEMSLNESVEALCQIIENKISGR